MSGVTSAPLASRMGVGRHYKQRCYQSELILKRCLTYHVSSLNICVVERLRSNRTDRANPAPTPGCTRRPDDSAAALKNYRGYEQQKPRNKDVTYWDLGEYM